MRSKKGIFISYVRQKSFSLWLFWHAYKPKSSPFKYQNQNMKICILKDKRLSIDFFRLTVSVWVFQNSIVCSSMKTSFHRAFLSEWAAGNSQLQWHCFNKHMTLASEVAQLLHIKSATNISQQNQWALAEKAYRLLFTCVQTVLAIVTRQYRAWSNDHCCLSHLSWGNWPHCQSRAMARHTCTNISCALPSQTCRKKLPANLLCLQ